jgi:hypothetical protein
MMSVVSPALLFMSESDGTRFGGYEKDFGAFGKVFCASQGVDNEGR